MYIYIFLLQPVTCLELINITNIKTPMKIKSEKLDLIQVIVFV